MRHTRNAIRLSFFILFNNRSVCVLGKHPLRLCTCEDLRLPLSSHGNVHPLGVKHSGLVQSTSAIHQNPHSTRTVGMKRLTDPILGAVRQCHSMPTPYKISCTTLLELLIDSVYPDARTRCTCPFRQNISFLRVPLGRRMEWCRRASWE